MKLTYEPSKFKQWVIWYGVKELGEELGIFYMTLTGWLSGKSFPRVESMTRMIEISKFKLSYDDIILGCYHEAEWFKKRNNHPKKPRKKPALEKKTARTK